MAFLIRMRPNFIGMLAILFALVFGRHRPSGRDKFNRENDPVRYMRELEFRNTIDQYDLAIVVFFKKDVDECKRMLPGFKYAASKAKGRADFIAIASKAGADLGDELGVDKFRLFFPSKTVILLRNLKIILPEATFPLCEKCYFVKI
jgi:hypothetical protein